MHLHAEHSIFFEQRRTLAETSLAVFLTVSVLVVNASASNTTVSAVGASIGALLLLVSWANGQRRLKPALAWVVTLVALTVLANVFIASNFNAVVETSVRVLCGIIWILWVGTMVDWASLRLLCSRFGSQKAS